MSDSIDLLRPWIERLYGCEVNDPVGALEEFRALIPGELPSDYADTVVQIKRAVSFFIDTIIQAIEKAPPREPGQFTYMSDMPAFGRMYGLKSERADLFKTWDALKDRMPPGLVPIGDDEMGNEICVDVSEEGNGRIYAWFHEGDPGPDDAQGRPGWKNTFLLATSFTDLLHRLRKDDPAPDDAPIGRICGVRP